MRLIILLFIITALNMGHSKVPDSYLKVFPKTDKIETLEIPDPISDNPINTKLIKLMKGKKILGFVREISTTTGCNSACLPVVYTSFYSSNGLFLKLKSKDGLTKINHAPFTTEDYSQLEILIVTPNPMFSNINNPKEMTDAISGATVKEFVGKVVPGAAYSTLRIYLYNQQTQNFLKKMLKL